MSGSCWLSDAGALDARTVYPCCCVPQPASTPALRFPTTALLSHPPRRQVHQGHGRLVGVSGMAGSGMRPGTNMLASCGPDFSLASLFPFCFGVAFDSGVNKVYAPVWEAGEAACRWPCKLAQGASASGLNQRAARADVLLAAYKICSVLSVKLKQSGDIFPAHMEFTRGWPARLGCMASRRAARPCNKAGCPLPAA